MRLALIADTFPPLRTSGAVQLRDLSREFIRQGHSVTVILPDADQQSAWALEQLDGLQILRLKALRTKDVGHVRRAFAELTMPFVMLRQLRKSPLAEERWDGVVWYSPSIFHGPLANALKTSSACKGYLIVRDIFPEWAVDMGLMGRGLPYRFFASIARYQYSVADVIGIQASSNSGYFAEWQMQPGHRLEVLQNWLGRPKQNSCPIRLSETALAGRKVLVYAGNMGIAQGLGIILDLAEKFSSRRDIGFLFVGRGTGAKRLRTEARQRKLSNVLFCNEIDPDEIAELYAQCVAGIVALDPRHRSHNIPGKFLTYMQNGLPVLANVNLGNDIADLIRSARVGQVCESHKIDELIDLTNTLLDQVEIEHDLPARCRGLFEREFAVEKAVCQIIASLT